MVAHVEDREEDITNALMVYRHNSKSPICSLSLGSRWELDEPVYLVYFRELLKIIIMKCGIIRSKAEH